MKRVLILLLLLAAAVASWADNPVEIDGLYYNLINKVKKAEITKSPNGYSGEIVIPGRIEYDGLEYEVIIGKRAFEYSNISSVIISEGITEISEYAFWQCNNLKYITIPQSLKKCFNHAFPNGIAKVYIKDLISWMQIETEDYWSRPNHGDGYNDLIKLYINNEEIKNLIIPEGVSSITDYAFSYFDLESVSFPKTLKTIGNYAFMWCFNLKSLHIEDLKSYFGIKFGGYSTDTDDYDFNIYETQMEDSSRIYGNPLLYANKIYLNGEELNDLIIPEELEIINGFTMTNNIRFHSITVPSRLKYVGRQCHFITDSLIVNDLEKWCSITSYSQFCANHLILNGEEVKNLVIPNGIVQLTNFGNIKGITSIKIPNSVTSIGEYVFSGCIGLTSIEIPNSVTRIGNRAFSGCTGIQTILIPSSMREIGNYAFAYCPELKDFYCCSNPVPGKKMGRYEYNYNLFMGSYIEYATLYVPKTSINNYKSNTAWSEFGNIVPLPQFKLIYSVDGQEYKVSELEVGTNIVAESPTKEGYTFSGWTDLPETMPAHDVTVTGTYTINKYKIVYMVDGVEYRTSEVEYGAEVNPVSEPSKDGYTFSGWSEIPETMPAHDVTVKGTFTVNSYILTYMVDGQEYKTESIKYGSTITAETTPTKEGYIFSGWSEIPETMPAHDVTVIGTFSINNYTLTYMVDGKEYKTTSVKYGSTITAEAAPTKEGYTFSGWDNIPATMPAHDVTVTGTFTVNSYTLTYMVDGVEYKTVSVKYGATITAETAPTKEGYTFSGWDNIPATMPAHDVTVTGTFTINSYTLTYMVDGQEYKKASVKYGSTITAEAAPTKEGYTFSGWSDIPKTMPAHNVTVTGTFSINSYTLTYLVDGVKYKTTSVKYGSTIIAETIPTKEGYTFSGCSEIPATMPAHDVTVTGTFAINSYTLTYMVDGQEYKKASVKYGTSITAEAAPTKEGYTFSGWSEIPKTMPAHDVTVTGTFTINKYKVTFVVDGQVYGTTEIEYGADVNPIGEPAKEGYTFSGWQNLPEDMPAHDITVTGTFTVNQYKVTFKYGKNVLTTIDVDYGAVIPLPESLNSERYTLIEWLDVPETMPARDIIIYADYVDGIDTITADSKDVQYIQMNGMYTNELKQGLNIIRMSDGTTKKVWVK